MNKIVHNYIFNFGPGAIGRVANDTHLILPPSQFQETEVYKYYQTRREEELRVTKEMLTSKMEMMLMENDQGDDDYIQKNVAIKWLNGFMKEYRISLQRRTNKKAKSIY